MWKGHASTGLIIRLMRVFSLIALKENWLQRNDTVILRSISSCKNDLWKKGALKDGCSDGTFTNRECTHVHTSPLCLILDENQVCKLYWIIIAIEIVCLEYLVVNASISKRTRVKGSRVEWHIFVCNGHYLARVCMGKTACFSPASVKLHLSCTVCKSIWTIWGDNTCMC